MATQSDTIISAASQRYGVIDYSRWQAIRWQWYSYVTYSATTAPSELNFFGQVAGQTGVTLADTNLPKAGSFGQTHFLLKTISTDIRLGNNDVDGFTLANQATLDRRAIASDFLNGFVQAGVLEFSIGARPFATIPKPFMYAPPPGNDVDYENSYAPQILAMPTTGTTQVTGVPFATQTRNRNNVYVMDPNILIEAEQQFAVKLSYPSGAIPIIAADTAVPPAAPNGDGVVYDPTNPLKVGIIFDGVLLRPMQ